MRVKLQGRRAAEAEAVREGARLDGLEGDLRTWLSRSRTLVASDAEAGLRELPAILKALVAVDDAEWWLTHRQCFRPLTSEARYEAYPGDLWALLHRQFGGGRQFGQAPIAGELAVDEVPRSEWEALAPDPAPDLVAALKKGGHRAFVRSPEGFVAIHDRGARFVGSNGKVVSRNVPKGQGGVTHGSLAGDGSVLIGNVPWGIHRVDPAAGTLGSYGVPIGIGEQGFCGTTDGVAVMEPSGALRLCRFGPDALVEVVRAEHPDLTPRAALESVLGPPDLLFARCRGEAGRVWTLVASWGGVELRWLGRLEFEVWGPRADGDGAVVAAVDRTRCVRIRV